MTFSPVIGSCRRSKTIPSTISREINVLIIDAEGGRHALAHPKGGLKGGEGIMVLKVIGEKFVFVGPAGGCGGCFRSVILGARGGALGCREVKENRGWVEFGAPHLIPEVFRYSSRRWLACGNRCVENGPSPADGAASREWSYNFLISNRNSRKKKNGKKQWEKTFRLPKRFQFSLGGGSGQKVHSFFFGRCP